MENYSIILLTYVCDVRLVGLHDKRVSRPIRQNEFMYAYLYRDNSIIGQ